MVPHAIIPPPTSQLLLSLLLGLLPHSQMYRGTIKGRLSFWWNDTPEHSTNRGTSLLLPHLLYTHQNRTCAFPPRLGSSGTPLYPSAWHPLTHPLRSGLDRTHHLLLCSYMLHHFLHVEITFYPNRHWVPQVQRMCLNCNYTLRVYYMSIYAQ